MISRDHRRRADRGRVKEEEKYKDMLTVLKVGRREHAGHGMTVGHLLQHLNEEANLHLGGLLQEGIQRRGALGLAQDLEPLLDGAQLVLEILIQGGGGHLFERGLVLIDVGDPLLCRFVGGILGAARVLLLLSWVVVHLRCRPDSTGERRGGRGRHVRRRSKDVTRTNRTSRRRT